ncbi:MFS transporter [Clostridium sp. YIM B02515]|uniref:MFS transporter n=1 Tax=Clostridium rhizosphaerae TaxID=2803861 RepID=A0ABS1T8N1_9CLOT|nr:MFS transporter [Clostridium rhizosphaerae]MBL4935694.1 MFS transporter [Clostridium rhizosphaerae]
MEGQVSTGFKTESIFKNKNFMLLFIGKLVSQFGDVIYNMAIGWYILSVTSSAIQMSIYMALGTVVYIVMGPIGGVIADRYDRKKIIIWMDIIRGIAVAVTGILMYFNIESIYLFYISSTILSICGALFVPASNAMMPMIVDDNQLTKANSMGGSVGSMANIVGTIVGGILYALLGIKIIFVLNAVSYIACGILEVLITMPSNNRDNNGQEDSQDKKHIFKELSESYSFVKNQNGLFILMWFSTIINFILIPLMAVYVPYIFNQILKVSTEQYSYVGAASAVGFIIGATTISMLPQRDKIYKYINMSLIAFSILIFSIYFVMLASSKGILPSKMVVILFIAIYLFIGMANSILNIPIGVVVQRLVPNEILGKVTSLLNTLIMAAMPLGMLMGGATADLMPMNMLLLITSVIFSIITIYLSLQKDIRRI